MTRTIIFTSLALAAAIAGAGQASAASSDEAQIRALEAGFGKAFEAKNLKGMVAVYAPEVTVFHPAVPAEIHGAAAYGKVFEGYLASIKGPAKFTETGMTLTVAGDMAFVESIQAAGPADAKLDDTRVRVTDIYRKQGGKWRIVHEHVSFIPKP